MKETLLPPWDAYFRLQTRAKNTATINSGSWGLEEEMNLFLEDPDAYLSGKAAAKLKTTNASAARRERSQAQMRKQRVAELAPEPADPNLQLDAREKLRLIHGSMSPANWQVLLNVAHGHKYGKLARSAGMKPGTMRVLVSRLRAQVAHLHAA